MGWRLEPESILTADNGTLKLDDSGDPDVAAEALRQLAERFGAVVRERFFRNLMGDAVRQREYSFLDLRGREYTGMRCTAPEPPGVCVMGPIGTRGDLALFRAIAASFGAVVQDRRPRAKKPWWRIC